MNPGKLLRACLFLATSLEIGLAPPTATATPVGAIPGQFAVSETGVATYSIHINVAPDVAGLEFKLALTYNSQGVTV